MHRRLSAEQRDQRFTVHDKPDGELGCHLVDSSIDGIARDLQNQHVSFRFHEGEYIIMGGKEQGKGPMKKPPGMHRRLCVELIGTPRLTTPRTARGDCVVIRGRSRYVVPAGRDAGGGSTATA